jgi:hypothetical protein
MGTLHYDYSWRDPDEDVAPLDPRWLDLAVQIKHVGLVHHVGRPGHPAMEAFLRAELDTAIKAGREQNQLFQVAAAMVRNRHPDAANAVATGAEKVSAYCEAEVAGFAVLASRLPMDAIPQLEAVVPRLKGRAADVWVAAIEVLRNKT